VNVELCRWKGGCTFAYSITYDEGFEDLLEHALPVHRRHGIPGHVVMVAGQLGQVRQVPSSTYDGLYRHLSGPQLRDLIEEGWSVGDHSLTHGDLNEDPYKEVVTSKHILEDAIGQTVTLFHLPGADFSYAPAARFIDQMGFLAVFFCDDRVNDPDPDLMGLARCLVYGREGEPWHPLYDPFPRVYDPYHRLHEARASGGWLIDITHLVAPHPPAPWKDATPEQLEARFDCLRRAGGGAEWAAEPEEVVDYILLRRATTLELLPGTEPHRFRMHVRRMPPAIKHQEISLAISETGSDPLPQVWLEGQALQVTRSGPGRAICTFAPRDGAILAVGAP
jgi:peptidoglycan/xylan/chitin deacetylase (PgdA/CDA1 family)